MPRSRARTLLLLGLSAAATRGAPLEAQQPLATFRWQLQPFCNVLTLEVTPRGGVYALNGIDDQCGLAPRASVVGTAFLHPDGSVGLGLTTVVAPGGTPVHVDGRIDVQSLGGTWRDSAGHSGTLVFSPGPAAPGPVRPVPANGIAPGSITAAHIATGAIGLAQLAAGIVGLAQVNTNQVQARVSGTCPVGQYLRGIHENGTVLCEPLLTPHVSTTVDDGPGFVGRYSSLAMGADGFPVIAHLHGDLSGVRITKCHNATCTANLSRTIATTSITTASMAIAVGRDGLPIVAHAGNNPFGLRVTHCGNLSCTSGNTTVTADQLTSNIVGRHVAIAIGIDGLPIISHQDMTRRALRVTHCGNAACSAGNVSTTVDAPGNPVGEYTDIAIGSDGLPVISHHDAGARALRVTHCGNVTCTAGNISLTVDSPGFNVGFYTSIAIGADGLPIVTHQAAESGSALRVTHCGNMTCTAGTVSTTVDGDQVGNYSSIAIGTDGLPVVAHGESRNEGLRLTRCGNVTCTAGNSSHTIDAPGFPVGHFVSLAIAADGLPVISHAAINAAALRVTKCATKTCQ